MKARGRGSQFLGKTDNTVEWDRKGSGSKVSIHSYNYGVNTGSLFTYFCHLSLLSCLILSPQIIP